ncbi:cache domain-containing sensor histidine kinase [Lederbergia citri]|uniref:Sensor histidine kinase n=1 Tax=Lederbergia citri TaxID=2833580 RepID=A0A942YGG1_9BACI|nr:sensor histidine kinase [Lederbergia citri]MBS4196113.1 sensor histidine kinase [Lederbergia citri]
MKFLNRYSLKQKLTAMTLVSILIPILFLGIYSYKIAAKLSEEKAIMSGADTLQLLKTNMEFMLVDVENMSIFLIGNDQIQSYLSNPEKGVIEKSSISGFLTNLTFSKKYISNIYLKSTNGGPVITATAKIQNVDQNLVEKYMDSNHVNSKWWSSLDEGMTPVGYQRVLTLSRPIRTLHKFENVGYLSISLDMNYITKQLLNNDLANDGTVLLLNENNQIIAGSSKKWLNHDINELYPSLGRMGLESGVIKIGKGKELKTILYSKIPDVNWSIIGVIPAKGYLDQNHYFLVLSSIAVAFALILAAGLVLFLSQKVIGPLIALTRALSNPNPALQVSKLKVTSEDEVGQLIKSYNKLNNRIRKLMDRVKQNEALKKEMDMLALQAQINPHFLYNTLSSIQWMALMNKDQKTAKMVSSLSEFLRFSLNRGEEFCAVSQEISHVKNYVNIQSLRYPDKIDFEISTEPHLEDKMMLKLLLQPIIENAIMHGILKMNGKGKILVVVKSDESKMKFSVTDNGIGMDEEQVKKINKQLYEESIKKIAIQKESYGLKNVHKRLVLYYGQSAGLKISSKKNEGTIISFAIPFLEGSSQ